MKAKGGVDDKWFIETHFKDLIGKIYRPFEDEDIYSLALDKAQHDINKKLITKLTKLKDYFIVVDCNLNEDPKTALTSKTPITYFVIIQNTISLSSS